MIKLNLKTTLFLALLVGAFTYVSDSFSIKGHNSITQEDAYNEIQNHRRNHLPTFSFNKKKRSKSLKRTYIRNTSFKALGKGLKKSKDAKYAKPAHSAKKQAAAKPKKAKKEEKKKTAAKKSKDKKTAISKTTPALKDDAYKTKYRSQSAVRNNNSGSTSFSSFLPTKKAPVETEEKKEPAKNKASATASTSNTKNEDSKKVEEQDLDVKALTLKFLGEGNLQDLEEMLAASEESADKVQIYSLTLQHLFSGLEGSSFEAVDTFIKKNFQTHKNAPVVSKVFTSKEISLRQKQYSLNLIHQLVTSLTDEQKESDLLKTYTTVVRSNIPTRETASDPDLIDAYMNLDYIIETASNSSNLEV